MTVSILCLVIAAVLFALSALSRWWAAPPNPYYPTLISAGLFFAVLSALWPQISK